VNVVLQVADNQLILSVADNGRGITAEEIGSAKAFGLIGMRERVLVLKGQLRIDGRPGRGTTVSIHIPLSKGEDSP
jgi:signal transduction histidine kinase